jgi:hypothetical protein
MKSICLLFLFLVISNFSFADTAEQWIASGADESKSLTIEIKRIDGGKIINYYFIYDYGRRMNEHSEEMPPIYIKKIDSNCFRANIFDEQSRNKADVIMCMAGEKIYWAKIDDPLKTPYIPNYEIFIKKRIYK